MDRLTDEPQGVEIPMYLNGNKERVDVGSMFIIGRIEACSEQFIGVELEAIPVSRFNPNYHTGENPLVGEEPGPAVSPLPEGGLRDRANLALVLERHWRGWVLRRW